MPSFNPSNVPGDTTMIDFRSAVDDLGSAAKSCRFAIQILPAGLGPSGHFINRLGYLPILKDLVYLCEAVEFPGRGFDYVETRHYGPSFNMPYNTKYNNEFSVSIITRQEAFERQLFDDWLEVINPTNSFDFNYTDVYYSKIRVFQLQNKGASDKSRKAAPAYLWELHDAWPFQVNPQPVTWADNDILRLNITFTYRYWSRPGRDAAPGGAMSGPTFDRDTIQQR